MNFYDDRAVKFCQNIAQGLSPEKAAVEAGYSKKTARAKAYKWLEDDRAVSEIEKWKEKAKEVTIPLSRKLKWLSNMVLHVVTTPVRTWISI